MSGLNNSIGIRSVYSRRRFLRNSMVTAFSVAGMSMGYSQDGIRQASLQHLEVISRFADIILPRTATPSATDVNAHIFVMAFVDQAKGPEFSSRFYRGALDLANLLHGRYGFGLDRLSDDDITLELQAVLKARNGSDAAWFLYRFKQLLTVGWALCKEVAESAFAYNGGLYQYLPSTQSSQIIMSNYIDKEYLDL